MNGLRISFLAVLSALVFFQSCDNKPASTEVSDDKLKSFVDLKVGDYEKISSEAAGILEYRYEQEGKESYAAIEMDRWYYQYLAFGSDINPAENDEYLDFYPDLTYEYGDKSGKLGGGKYHYSMQTDLVLLVDNNPRVKPRQYTVLLSGSDMVLQGHATYGDNSFQCKMQMDYVERKQEASLQ